MFYPEGVEPMVVKKINRINLLELKQITLRCQSCGASITLNSQATDHRITACPACRIQYSFDAEDIARLISKAYYLAEKNQEGFVIEFDVEEV